MHDADNLDRLGAYPVYQNVVRVGDGFASAFTRPERYRNGCRVSLSA